MDIARPGAGPLRPQCFDTAAAYTSAYPHHTIPARRTGGALGSYDAGGVGIDDDLYGGVALLRIDYLAGDAGHADHAEVRELVVASRQGRGGRAPVYVLTDDLPLTVAANTIGAQWPTTLTGVLSALIDARRFR